MNELLKHLIRTAPTAQEGELHAARVLTDYFKEHSIPTELDTWDSTRANVIASIGDDHPDAPTLLFGAHLDVVPATAQRWKTNPFKPVEKDGKVFGRGAVDMLGGLCSAAAAMAEMKNEPIQGRVLLAATAGEETDSSGVKLFVQKYHSNILNPIGILITEPTSLSIMRAHRGILWLSVRTFGKTVHGSMPEKGINAVLKMNALLNRLGQWNIPHTPHPLLGGSSISPNRISGGSATNIVPDECCLEIDIRTLPSQYHQDIIDSLQNLCDEIQQNDQDFKAQISTIRTVGALETPADSPFVKAVCDITGIEQTHAAGFTTDGPHFKEFNAPVLIFGPGDGTLCHKPDEFIEIAEMEKARQLYKDIITHIFK